MQSDRQTADKTISKKCGCMYSQIQGYRQNCRHNNKQKVQVSRQSDAELQVNCKHNNEHKVQVSGQQDVELQAKCRHSNKHKVQVGVQSFTGKLQAQQLAKGARKCTDAGCLDCRQISGTMISRKCRFVYSQMHSYRQTAGTAIIRWVYSQLAHSL